MELHACPMHDGMAGMAGMSGMAGMRGMDPAAARQTAAREQPAPTAFAICTCVTCCSASSVGAPEAPLLLQTAMRSGSIAPRYAAPLWPRIERPYSLPFGTAPPAAASLI